MKCKCPSHIHFIAIFVNFHFLFHYNDYIITKCCRPTCLRLTGPVQMWLMKPPGVKWPMLCQRDKPELKVRPVGQVKTSESDTQKITHRLCHVTTVSEGAEELLTNTKANFWGARHTHAQEQHYRKFLVTTLFLFPRAAAKRLNDHSTFPSWMNSWLIVNKISLSHIHTQNLNIHKTFYR